MSQTVSAGTAYYSYPSDAIRIWRVTLNGVNLPELDLSQLDADTGNSHWDTTSATPTNYFFDRSSESVVGLYPYPSSSGATLKIFYYELPTDLSSDSDIPFDSDVRLYPYHDLLIYHVSYRILVQEGRLDEAEQYRTLYEAGAEAMNANVGHKPVRQIKPSKEVTP